MAGDYYYYLSQYLAHVKVSSIRPPPLDISLLCSEIMHITLYHMHQVFNISSDTVALRQLHRRRSKIAAPVISRCNMSFTNLSKCQRYLQFLVYSRATASQVSSLSGILSYLMP